MTVTHSLQFNGDDKVFIAPIMTTDADTAVANIHDVVGLVQLVESE